MASEIYVMLVDRAKKAVAVKGPFEEAQTDEIYSAIDEFEQDYNLNSQNGWSLCQGGQVRVMRTVYVKEPTL